MRVDQSALQRSVQELLADIRPAASGGRSLSQGLAALVSAAEHILGVDCVGILLIDEDERLRAVASSGPIAASLETSQQDLGIGPGVDTVRRSITVTVDDLGRSEDYAALRARVVQRGVVAIVSAPVWVNGGVAGNLNAIRSEPHEWSAGEVAAVETYADVVGTLLQFSASGFQPSGGSQRSAAEQGRARGWRAGPERGNVEL